VAVYNALGFVPTTLPERSDDIPDFAYGDPREAMAASTIMVQDVKDHCWIGLFFSLTVPAHTHAHLHIFASLACWRRVIIRRVC